MLFYQRNLSNNDDNTNKSTKPKEKKKKEISSVDISSTSQKTQKKTQTPTYRIYSREQEGLLSLVILIEVPLIIKSETIDISVSKDGTFSFQSPDLYLLKVKNSNSFFFLEKNTKSLS